MATKKILALMASPRKGGNTDTLVSSLLKAAGENGADIEKIYLADHVIKPCVQCEYCHEDGASACNIADDFGAIAEKMAGADIIVLATPIWWSSMHSLLKLLLDRCYSLLDKNWSNFKLQGKGFIVVACQTQGNLDLYANPLVKEFEVYQEWLKIKVIGSLVASAEGKGDVGVDAEIMEKASRLGVTAAAWAF